MFSENKAFDEVYQTLSLPKVGSFLTAEQAMELSWSIALQGVGFIRSNPLVGAVCVDKDHRFVAGAGHESFGKPHAEQSLIAKIYEKKLTAKLKEATIYVTLEPCAHIGKTPSCAHLLAKLPLKKIVYGLPDPTAKTSKKGPAFLIESGIDVSCYEGSLDFKKKLQFLVDHFYHFEMKKSPFVSVKVAATLNGVFAHSGDSRKWITGERARAYGHWLRLLHDAVMVGADTVIRDNPALTVRYGSVRRTPQRVVIDPDGRALTFHSFEKNNLLNNEAEKTLWCLSKKAWERLPSKSRYELKTKGLKTLFLQEKVPEEIFEEILCFLFSQGTASLLLEGGAGVWSSAFNQSRVNKLYLFQAPKLFCAEQIMYWTKGIKINYLDLENMTVTRLQEDLLIEGYTKNKFSSL